MRGELSRFPLFVPDMFPSDLNGETFRESAVREDRISVVPSKSTSERSANVLIKDQIAKIADFGLSRIIASGDYEQKKLSKYDSKFPVRFTAPETVIDPSKQSTEGDVWSFGILIYEILSYGKRPFSEVPLEEVKFFCRSVAIYDKNIFR